MATALYRRYRPESFAEVIGQDHVTEPLRRALASGRVGHAYLFSGPRGCGKTTSARILARCLNCSQGPTPTPCGTCESCVELARGGAGSLDVVEIDAASHGGVDDARELRERAAFAPVRDRFKVFIIDEAHMVTSAGFNALLKLVEEPPEHVKFIFATTEPDKVIGTIRSRTHHYPFRLIPPQILIPYLEEICREEGVKVADGVVSLAVRSGGGSARDTLSVLDQLIAGSDERGVELDVATNLLGFTNIELLNRAVDAVAERDAAGLFTAIDEVIGSGHEPRRFVEDLLERFRDLIVLAAAPDQAAELLPDVPQDQLERLSGQAERFQPREMTECATIVSEALNSMVGATSPRLHLELLAAKLVLRADGAAVSPGMGSGASSSAAPGAAAGAPGAHGGVPAPATDGLTPRQRAMQAARLNVAAARERQQREQHEESSALQGQERNTALREHRESTAPKERGESTAPREREVQVPESAPVHTPEGAPVQQGAGQHADPQQNAPQAGPKESEQPTPPSRARGEVHDIEQNWSALMDTLQTIRRPSWALIAQNGGIHSFDGSQLVLQFRSQGLVAAFYRGTAQENMAQAVKTIMRLDVTVEATTPGGEPGPRGEPGPGGGPTPAGAAPHGGWQQSPPQPPAQPRGPQGSSPQGSSPAPGGWATVAIPHSEPTRTAAADQTAPEAQPLPVSQPEPAPQPDPGLSHASAAAAPAGPEDWHHREPPPEDPYGDPYDPPYPDSEASDNAPEPARTDPGDTEPAREHATASDPATPQPPSPEPAPVAPRGQVQAVSLPPQPGEDEPRTHGQMELMGAMRRAYAASGFEPADSLITATAHAANTAKTASASQPSAMTQPAPAPTHPTPEAAPSPEADSPLTGAALARQTFREAQEAAHAPAAAHRPGTGSAEDDPYGGASRDDEDAGAAATKRRHGREIVEEFLGGEVLEVIDDA